MSWEQAEKSRVATLEAAGQIKGTEARADMMERAATKWRYRCEAAEKALHKLVPEHNRLVVDNKRLRRQLVWSLVAGSACAVLAIVGWAL